MLPKTGIGGWLLVYIIWAVWSICYSVFANGRDLFYYHAELPIMENAALAVFIMVLIYSAIYAWLLLLLCRKQDGIIKKIKLMIAISPVFNASLPAIFAFVLSFSLPDGSLWQLIESAYPVPIIGSICGAIIMAGIWFVYFSVSKRVMTTWPNK